jgi:hypothetical protein
VGHDAADRAGLIGIGPTARGSRRRGYEYEIHPSPLKRLATGQAVVITPGSGPPMLAWMRHPREARAGDDG